MQKLSLEREIYPLCVTPFPFVYFQPNFLKFCLALLKPFFCFLAPSILEKLHQFCKVFLLRGESEENNKAG